MKKYEELQIDREHSKYPQGLKHCSKNEIFESTLFDIELIAYKLRGLWKGNDDGKRDKAGSQETDKSTAKEILRGFMQRILYADWDPEDTGSNDGAVEERYIEAHEGEQEDIEEGGEPSTEEGRV